MISILLTLKQIFWKTKTFFKKLENPFLVESTKIKNVSFPYKTTVSEANVKTNWMESTKWTYHKERGFASNFFIFWRFCFSLRTSYKELIWCTNDPNVHTHTFRKRWSFSLWVSLRRFLAFDFLLGFCRSIIWIVLSPMFFNGVSFVQRFWSLTIWSINFLPAAQ